MHMFPKEIEEKILQYVLELDVSRRLKNGWKGIHQELNIYHNDISEWDRKMYKNKVNRWRNAGFSIMISPRTKKFWKVKNRKYACICGHKNETMTKLSKCYLPGCNCGNYIIPEQEYACANCKRNPRKPWNWGFMRISL